MERYKSPKFQTQCSVCGITKILTKDFKICLAYRLSQEWSFLNTVQQNTFLYPDECLGHGPGYIPHRKGSINLGENDRHWQCLFSVIQLSFSGPFLFWNTVSNPHDSCPTFSGLLEDLSTTLTKLSAERLWHHLPLNKGWRCSSSMACLQRKEGVNRPEYGVLERVLSLERRELSSNSRS